MFLSYTSELAVAGVEGRSFVQAATDAINRAGDAPVAMKYFASSGRPPAEECTRIVRSCDLYVGLLGNRYGSVVPGSDAQSYVGLEFSVAGDRPRLMFLLDDASEIDEPQRAFRALARRERVVSTFRTPDELEVRIYQALVEADRDEPAGPAPYQVPALTAPAVDRPVLVDGLLAALVNDPPGTVAVTAVYGTGGFGKTTLAQMVCAQPEVRERFPGGILWVTLGEQLTGAQLAEKVSNVVVRLGGPRAFTDPEQAGLVLGELLDARPATLLVLDDVWTEEQLQPFLAGGGECTRLVTTRLPRILPRGVQPIRVDRMDRAEAQQLLTGGLPALDDSTVDQLLGLTGRWPLLLSLVSGAIEQAAEYASDPQAFADELARGLATDGPATAMLDTEAGRRRAVRATVEASLASLEDGERDRFIELAIFPEDADIPLDVLTLLWGRTAGLSPAAIQRLCWRLAGRSLVAGYRSDAEARALRLHDVIRAYVRRVAGPGGLLRTNRALREAAAASAGTEDGGVAWWRLPETQLYLWDHLIDHLTDADSGDEAASVASDWRWIAAKLVLRGPAAVEYDLTTADTAISRALARALGRTAHLLAPSDPRSAAVDTLRSRLVGDPLLVDYLASAPFELRPGLEARWPVPDRPDAALRRVLSGHTGRATACVFSPDGSWLASTGDDGIVRIWDMPSGSERFALDGHRGVATCCAAAPDGTWLVTGGRDRVLRVWDVVSGELRSSIRLDGCGTVLACTVGGGGEWIAAGTHRGVICVASVPDGNRLAELRGHVDPVTACAVPADGSTLVSAGNDETIRVWNPSAAVEYSVRREHTSGITGCAIAADGRWGVSSSHDGTVHLWPIGDADGPRKTLTAHAGGVMSCALAPDGRWVASGGQDSRIRIWDVETAEIRSVLAGHAGGVTGCAVSADGRWLASSGEDGTVRLWEPATGTLDGAVAGRSGGVSGCAIAPDGAWLAGAGEDSAVELWHVGSASVRTRLTGHEAQVTSCAIAPGGDWLVSVSEDGTARVWDPATGRALAVATGHASRVSGCAVSPDGTWFATVGDDWTVRRWESRNGKLIATLNGHEAPVSSCVISADGTQIVSVGADRTVRFWDVGSGEPLRVWTGHDDVVTGCALDPAGRWAVTTSRDGTVMRWDALTGQPEPVARLGNWVTACAADRTGRWVASVGHDAMLRVWDMGSGVCAAGIRVEGALEAVAWDPMRDRICAAGDRGVYLLDYRSGGGRSR
ncbi:NB-ARC domain-containing protein [Cryptosporangium sp. NPDC051539]|uniref:NB-ARC domain-containing protein n=1 Tax=Cryptosporangium sp. NPDC051539 TaxID=3363962 RepID=UPI0037BB168E